MNSPKKRGRPKESNPRNKRFEVRMTQEQEKLLAECSEKAGITKRFQNIVLEDCLNEIFEYIKEIVDVTLGPESRKKVWKFANIFGIIECGETAGRDSCVLYHSKYSENSDVNF